SWTKSRPQARPISANHGGSVGASASSETLGLSFAHPNQAPVSRMKRKAHPRQRREGMRRRLTAGEKGLPKRRKSNKTSLWAPRGGLQARSGPPGQPPTRPLPVCFGACMFGLVHSLKHMGGRPLAQVSLPMADRHFGQTSRRDAWWVQPLLVFLGLSAFIVYA